jgi:hypothetical protein
MVAEGEEEGTITHSMLQDVLRGVSIFLSTHPHDLDSVERVQMQDFSQAYKLMLEIHSLHTNLESSGHPDYQVSPNLRTFLHTINII